MVIDELVFFFKKKERTKEMENPPWEGGGEILTGFWLGFHCGTSVVSIKGKKGSSNEAVRCDFHVQKRGLFSCSRQQKKKAREGKSGSDADV